MVVIIPHVQSFGTLVDTLKASNVSACHPYINFCSVALLASSSTERCPVPPTDTYPSAQRLESETHPIILCLGLRSGRVSIGFVTRILLTFLAPHARSMSSPS